MSKLCSACWEPTVINPRDHDYHKNDDQDVHDYGDDWDHDDQDDDQDDDDSDTDDDDVEEVVPLESNCHQLLNVNASQANPLPYSSTWSSLWSCSNYADDYEDGETMIETCFGEHFGKSASILSAAWMRSSPGQPEPLWEAIVAHHQ